MKLVLYFLSFLLGISEPSFSQDGKEELPKLNMDVGIPKGKVMVCQFDQRVIKSKKSKREDIGEYFSMISGKSAQVCEDSEGLDDPMSCKRYEFVGKNDGGSVIYVTNDGFKLTTNILALALGAGVSIESLDKTVATTYTGQCREGDISLIKKRMPAYKE